jgi:trimeric autotransporter adhesin
MNRNRIKLHRISALVVFPLVIAFAISGAYVLPVVAQDAAPAATAGAASPQAQETPANVTLNGSVSTSRGVAVPGATVRIRHVASGKGWETLTDEDGNFSVANMPAGQYHIEAQQLGVGAAIWDNEIKSESGQQTTIPESIDLVLRRKSSVEQPAELKTAGVENAAGGPQEESVKNNSANSSDTAAVPKKHHKASVAEDSAGTSAAAKTDSKAGGATPNTTASSAASTVASNSNTPGGKPAKAAMATGDATKTPKSKKGGFEQVEPDGILTANADLGDQAPAPSVAGGATTNQSSEAYLISGAVGRGSTASGLDGNGQDELSAVDNAAGSSSSGKAKKPKHQSSGGHTQKGNSKAQLGDNLAGGVADLTVRDTIKHLGSNQMHATFYNYYGSSIWDARPYQINGGPQDMIAHFGERFGANVGGPLTIPKIYSGNDRTFWFANYELNRNTDPVTLFANLPTVSERTGNFCDRIDPVSGLPVQLFDPLTGLAAGPRQSFGCALPAGRLDNAARKLVALMPLPNEPGFNNNYERLARSPKAIDIVNFRILHTISPRFNVSGVFNFVSARGDVLTRFPSLNGNSATRDQNITLTFTQNWTPRLANETKVNFNRSRNQIFSTNAFTNNLDAQLGITGVSQLPIDFGAPDITFANFSPVADPGPLLVRNQTLRFMDNISYTVSKHTLRAGAEIRRRELNSYADPTGRGVFDFSGVMTSQLDASGNSIPNTGLDFADFLLGLSDNTEVQFGTSSNYGRQWQFATYVQDDWRIAPRFSVNYGVRYEIFAPFVEKHNHLAALVVDPNITQVSVALPGQTNPIAGVLPNSIVRPNYRDFVPRIGIAWKPLSHGGPVVRAGYGIFNNGAVLDQIYLRMLNQPPWAQARSILPSATQLLTLENGYPPATNDSVPNTIGLDPNYRIGYAQIWNLSVEQQIGNQYVIEFLYTGTKGTHLDLTSDPNQAAPGSALGSDQRRRIPTASGFSYVTSGADSIYNGFQVRAQRRMSNGFRVLFLYTLGHAIDDASSIGIGTTAAMVQDYNNLRAERGNSNFDIRNDIRTSLGYDLPFGDRRRWLRSGIGAKLLGNWQLINTIQYASGNHLTPYITAQNTSGIGPLFSQRPDIIGNPNLPSSQQTINRFFNVSAFALPAVGHFGNASRGSIVGPSYFNVNLAIERRMHFGPDGKYMFEFRWETQNLTNAVTFDNVITVVDASDAGLVTGAKGMRTMDLFLRLHF